MNKHSHLLALLLLLLGSGLSAQPLSEWLKYAENAFQKEDYYSATRYYETALLYDSTRMDLWYLLGESSRRFTAYRGAREAFERVADSPQRDSFPLLPFRQGQVHQSLGNYEQAADFYESFIVSAPAGYAKELDEAEDNLISSEWAIDRVSRRLDVEVNHLGEGVNSRYSDFGYFLRGDTAYFSSLRYILKEDTVVPPREIIKILRILPGEEPQPLPRTINPRAQLAGHTAYNTDGTHAYFTICDYIGGSTDVRCDLYRSPIGKNGEWSDPVRLSINDPDSTNTQPNVGLDPNTGIEYLYFASNRSGGQGGLDLYRSVIQADGKLGEPQPLTALNTDGNDGTPFYYRPTQALYFSSDGRLTLGGFDIYRSSWNGEGWNRPTHLSIPVNSSYNDLYYARFADEEKAYFASNRPDSVAIFWDESRDACCNDIYGTAITDEVRLKALTFNKLDASELDSTTVELYQITPDGPVLVGRRFNPDGNDFLFGVEPGQQYELRAIRPGFTSDVKTVDLTDPALADKQEIEEHLFLSPGVELDVFTFNGLDQSELPGTTVFLYELTDEGQVLVDSIVNPTANDHHFQVQRDKKYLIYGRKDGFTPASSYLDMTDPQFEKVERIERDLFLEPGLVLEAYTFRKLDGNALDSAMVYLYELGPDGEPILVDSTFNSLGNQFNFPVERGKVYLLRAERDGYGPTEEVVDLTGPDVPLSGTVRRDLYMGQLLRIFTYDSATELPLPGVAIELVDPITGRIIAEDINAEGNNFEFTIDLNRPYLLRARRKGYESVEAELEFTPQDLIAGNGILEFDLYLNPLDDPRAFLPLNLYFDNDRPDPRSYLRTTNREYVETNVAYYRRKAEFIETFTEGMDRERAFQTRRRFNDFFDREVRGGRLDLELFSEKLLTYLENGNEFELVMQGFASPRASTAYNEILSARRIDCVRNYFEQYQDGVFREYLDSGALSFRTEPLGETKADPRVIDRLDDPRNSIYDILASLERRVQICSDSTCDND